MVGRVRAHVPLVDMDNGDRRKGAHLGRERRHGCAENHGQHQTDQTGRQVLRDEGQEDVIRVAAPKLTERIGSTKPAADFAA